MKALSSAFALLNAAAQETEGVIDTPPPLVVLLELRADGLTFQLNFWCDSRRSDFMQTASRVRIRVIRALRDAAVALPDPGASIVRLLDDPPEQS